MSKKKAQIRPIDQPLFNRWQALYLAFFSPQLYVDVAKRWRGFGGRYYLLLVAILVIPFSIRLMLDFDRYFSKNIVFPLEHMPQFTIQDGQAVFNHPMPYLVKNKQHTVVAIIDTTGQITGLQNYPQANFLVTKDKLYHRSPKLHLFFKSVDRLPSQDITVESLNEYYNQTFDGREWLAHSHLRLMQLILMVMIYPSVLFSVFTFLIFNLLLFGTLGQIFAHLCFKVRLPYLSACRLIAVASTAQLTLLFCLVVTNHLRWGSGFLYAVLLAGYFCYAVLCVKHASQQMVLA